MNSGKDILFKHITANDKKNIKLKNHKGMENFLNFIDKTVVKIFKKEELFAAVEEGLVSGETIRVSGFGSFQVKTRAERKGVNPKTGEEIVIPETKAVTFKPAVALKTFVNEF